MPLVAHAQYTLDTLRHIHPRPGAGLSAIWGYTAPDGREYALVGITGNASVSGGTSIVDITQDLNPQVVTHINGPNSTWRELKTYRHYAYVVTEASSATGVQIIDLSELPDTARLITTFNYTSGSNHIRQSHTISIHDGFMYLNGCAGWSPGGIVIFDLRGDPTNPQYVGQYQPTYFHDSYVLRDTIYGSAIYSGGGLYIADARNKSNIQFINKISYPGSGTHNAWVTKDRRYALTTDEIGTTQKNLKIWDIGNLPSVPTTPVATFTVNPASTIHNVHVRGDFAYCAWYGGYGLQIADITNTATPILAAGYNTSGGSLAWETYPYFPSGKVIIGDGSTGLWIFRFSGLAPRIPVTLLQPQHGDSLTLGLPITFRWTKSADLNKDPHYYEVHLTGPGLDTAWRANDSLSTFTDVQRLQEGETYSWRIFTRDEWNETPSPSTATFGYGSLPAFPVISVTSPNGGEIWQYNSVQNITWTSAFIDSVNISYKTAPTSPWITIVQGIPDSGRTFAWTIPNAPTSSARIRITSSNGSIEDSSNNTFSIVVPLIAVTPSAINFDDVGTGQSRTDTLRIQNTGTAPLAISNITSDSAAFSVSRSSLAIPAGGSDTVSVTFAPTEIRPYSSILRIVSDAPSSPTTIPLSGVGVPPLSVDEPDIPTTYSLEQNYPNPFNPSTTIKYSLPQAGDVSLKIFNLLGEEVASLIQNEQGAGTYTVSFDASGLSSGVYFYRIRTSSGFSDIKKMILLK